MADGASGAAFAIGALATTVVMIVGAASTLFLTRKNSPRARAIVYATAITLLIAALLGAVTGAVSHTRQQHGNGRA